MNMRKVLVAFLAVICIIASVSTFGTYAEGVSRVYAETDASVAQGSYGLAYIYLDDLADLATLNIAVHYDSEKISVFDHYNSVGCTLYDASNKDGCLQYSYIFDGNGNSEKTNLFNFWYQINEDAEIGNTYFDIVITDAYNTSRQPVDIGGSRCNFTITERAITKECYVYGAYDASTSVKEEFVLDYYFNTWEIASGSAVISYDPELFEVVEITNGEFLSGKLVDVNLSLKGSVYLSFLATEYNYYSDFLRIKFRTLKNVEETSQITLTFSQLCDLELNTLVCNSFSTNVYVNFDQTYTEDAPSISVSASYNAQSDKVTATIKLDENSRLGAGDFVLKFDSDALAYNSAQKGFAPNFFNVNDKDVADGILKFSILSLTDITDEQTVLTVVFEVKQACKDNVVLEIDGSGLTDSLVNPIMLNFVDASVKMLSKHTEADAVEENRVEATCTEDGSYDSVVYCSVCDSELSRETIVIPAGHVEGEWFTYWEPTCTDTGYRVKICAVCGCEIASQEIPATGHTAGEWITAYEPTCTETGYKYQICPVCGCEIANQEIPALGHTEGEWFTQWGPTCTRTGYKYQICDVCFCQIDGQEIPATGHSHNAVVTQPTCTTQGYTTHTCHCGDSYVDSDVDALGHTEGEWITYWEPTCTGTGYKVKFCDVCGCEIANQEIPALGHNEVSHDEQAPTCTAFGWNEYVTCSRCDYTTYVEIPATGHTDTRWEILGEPSCEWDGLKQHVCNICGSIISFESIPATGHTEGAVVVENNVAPDCVNTGSYDNVVYCTVCNAEVSRDTAVVPALGHTDGEWITDSNPTCTQPGSKHQVCATCGATINSESIPATEHAEGSVVVENNVAPDCENAGSYDNVIYCTVCEDELSRQTIVVPALGHKPADKVVENEVDATCTKDGSYDEAVYCTVCDKELERKTIVIPATGHTEGAVVVENNVAPDCINDGHYDNVVYCTVCNAEVSRDTVVVSALGHSYNAVVTAPICTEQGYTTYTCRRCGDNYKSNYVDATGHVWTWVTDKEPTYTETGLKHEECSVCHVTQNENTVIPVKTHECNYVRVVTTKPTCTQKGVETFTCSICNDTYTQDIAPTGHTYNTVVTNPTCTEQGYTTYTCHCGDTYVADEVAATGHTQSPFVVENNVAPTCTTDGSYDIVIYCAVCDAEVSRDTVVVSATGHKYNAVVTDPTCTTQGYTTHTCNCGDSYVDTYVPVTDHTSGSWITDSNPTCTTAGSKHQVCATCGVTINTESIPALGHTQSPFVVENNVAPTCTVDGSCDIVIYCAVCDTELSRTHQTVSAMGHSVVVVVVENYVESTCTTDGSYDNVTYCGNCNEELGRETIVVPATGHSIGNWTVFTEPTCTEAGEERRDCNNCDHYETNELAALGHDYSNGGSCALCGELSDGAVTGIVAGSAVAVGGGGFSLFWFVIRKKRLKK